jgi:predicted RNase H-like HicB family nuclease
MATNEAEVEEMEGQFEEMLRAVKGGFEILISQDGKPLAQVVAHPLERMLDMLRDEEPWYAVVLEQGEDGWTAYVPDLPDVIAAAETEDEVEDRIREAIGSHLQALRDEGVPVPEPAARTVYVTPSPRQAA